MVLEDQQGSLREYLAMDAPRREVAIRFRDFLRSLKENDQPIYRLRIGAMCSQNKRSLQVDYPHLAQHQQTLAMWVADAPKEMLEVHSIFVRVLSIHAA